MTAEDVKDAEKKRDALAAASAFECTTFMESLKQLTREQVASLSGAEHDVAKAALASCARADTATLTAGTVGTDLVRSVAQVVVDKVQRQGWEALRAELKDLGRCPSDTGKADALEATQVASPYANLCRVLETATIQDIVSSPEALLDAAAHDLLNVALRSANLEINHAARTALADVLIAGKTGSPQVVKHLGDAHRLGADVLVRRLRDVLLKRAQKMASGGLLCQPTWTSPEQALWVAGMCLIEDPSSDALRRCDFGAWVEKCETSGSEDSEKILQFLTAAQAALDSTSSSGRADAVVRLVFGMARAQAEEKLEPPAEEKALLWLGAFEDTMLGLTGRDWVRVVSGATRVGTYVIESMKECAPAADEDNDPCTVLKERDKKLLSLLGAIGNYALTYKDSDGEKAQADREKIMGELVDRMVSRTSKDRGLKFSLGGGLGLLGGARTPTDFDAAQAAFPVQLGLGFGLQSYGRNTGGFHLMATMLDLGQYVAVDNSELEVEEPNVEAAVTLGLSVGGWVWNRELPLYIAGYFGYSPFVRENEGGTADPTLQVGVATGFYVPLLDFN